MTPPLLILIHIASKYSPFDFLLKYLLSVVSPEHKRPDFTITGEIIILYILIFDFLEINSGRECFD
jgi:hypothetical protein